MSVAKLRACTSSDAMTSEEGKDSLDTFIRQAIGKEPFLSFSRTGDTNVQWIQLLHALDQQDVPGWPLLTPLKVQMQKCDKCSREFCSPINYRRHIRMHRRSLNVDKESHKNRDLLGAFWDKLSFDEAKEIVSFKEVTLEDVPGPSIVRTLSTFIRSKPGFYPLPQAYIKAGCGLLELIQAKLTRLPMSSHELFSILDDASEKTFLCAGTAESMQRYVFDGEAGKVGLEMKNLVACTSFLLEQKLVKAWLADKDAEALRCQKLLVEEEEAAQKRQAVLLERKRQKKLRQKAKEQQYGEKANIDVTSETSGDLPGDATTSESPAPSEFNSHALEIPGNLIHEEDADIEAQGGFSEHSDSGTVQNVESQKVWAKGRRHLVITQWQVPKSQKGGRNGFYGSQNFHTSELETVNQKHASNRDPRAVPVNGNKVWTKKPKTENGGESGITRVRKEEVDQTDQNKRELMIGSISVKVKDSTTQQQVNSRIEVMDNCNAEHAKVVSNNMQEKPTKLDSAQCGTTWSAVKFWRPVSRHGTNDQLPVQTGNEEHEYTAMLGTHGDDRTAVSEGCIRSHELNGNDCRSRDDSHSPLGEITEPEELPFSSRAAKAFLAERWKEAISGDHVTLVLSQGPESPGFPDAQNDCSVVTSAAEFQGRCILGNAENRLANGGAVESSKPGIAKAKFKAKPDKGVKIKYIPRQTTVK